MGASLSQIAILNILKFISLVLIGPAWVMCPNIMENANWLSTGYDLHPYEEGSWDKKQRKDGSPRVKSG